VKPHDADSLNVNLWVTAKVLATKWFVSLGEECATGGEVLPYHTPANAEPLVLPMKRSSPSPDLGAIQG
jgi:hypothetical protein